MKRAWILNILFIILFLFPSSALARTFVVSCYTGTDNARFAAALSDAASAGGVVYVGEDLVLTSSHVVGANVALFTSPGAEFSAATN